MEGNKQQKKIGMYFVIGFALFSMLFGSGNLIFPPEIGITGGTSWYQGYIAYFIADAVLGILSVFAMLKVDGSLDRLTGTIGRKGSVFVNLACIICIGPLLAIPRNAAVTFEMGIAPLLGIDAKSAVARLVFSIVFFAIVIVLTIRPSKVIDILGKYLTPVLVLSITALIIRGIISPAAEAGTPVSDTLIKDGILNGYQTLDLMAGIYFSIIVIQSIRDRKLSGAAEEKKTARIAALLAGGLLCFVYGGMAYLGATTGSQWLGDFQSGSINQAGLVVNIAGRLLGGAGVAVLSVIVSLACLTTAIGLTSAAAEYFAGLLKGNRSGDAATMQAADGVAVQDVDGVADGAGSGYARMVILICAVSAILCNFGLSFIIGIAAPILMLFYPPVMFLTLSALGRRVLRKKNYYRFGFAASLLVSALTVLVDTFGVTGLSFIHTALPLDAFGFNWLIPTLIAAAIGHFIPGPEIDG